MGAEWMVVWDPDDALSRKYLEQFDALTSFDPDDWVMLQCGLYRWDEADRKFHLEDSIGGVLWEYGTEVFEGETYDLDDPRFEDYQAEIVRDLMVGRAS